MRFSRFLATGAIATLVGGCALFIPRPKKVEPIPASNPLTGGELFWSTEPGDRELAEVTSDDCSVWPVEDTWTVTASADEVCIKAMRSESGNSGRPEFFWEHFGSPNMSVTTEKGTTAIVQPAPVGRSQKIGTCFVTDREYDVWTQEFSACVENRGVVDEAVASLVLNQDKHEAAAWRFSGQP